MHLFYATRSSGGMVLTHTVHILWVPRSSYLAIPIQAYAAEVRRAQKNNHHPTRPFFLFLFSFKPFLRKFSASFPRNMCSPRGNAAAGGNKAALLLSKGRACSDVSRRLLRHFPPSSSSALTRSISELVRSNGKRAFLVDTLALVLLCC